jgi:hypothetical protein
LDRSRFAHDTDDLVAAPQRLGSDLPTDIPGGSEYDDSHGFSSKMKYVTKMVTDNDQ